MEKHDDNSWKKDRFIVIDDSQTEKTGEDIPGVGIFFDHAEAEYVIGQDLITLFAIDEKTGYPLAFRLYEEGDDAQTNIDLAKQ